MLPILHKVLYNGCQSFLILPPFNKNTLSPIITSKGLISSPWTVTLPSDCYLDEVLLLAIPKNDGWGGLADGTWAVCPGLARGAGCGSCVG